MIFSSGSDRVEKYTAGRSGLALRKVYCWAMIVLPVPGSPMMTLIPLPGRPPPSTSSSGRYPLVSRLSLISCSCR